MAKEENMAKALRQTVTLHAPPNEVYDLLMNSKKHGAFTHAKAEISTKVGGRISAYDGYISGKNIELKPGKRIVQLWHAADWPDELESTVVFEFQKVKSGTKLIFTHKNIPMEDYDDIKQGWIENYWNLMKEYFDKKK
jgi:activator of HSP90 ATPase